MLLWQALQQLSHLPRSLKMPSLDLVLQAKAGASQKGSFWSAGPDLSAAHNCTAKIFISGQFSINVLNVLLLQLRSYANGVTVNRKEAELTSCACYTVSPCRGRDESLNVNLKLQEKWTFEGTSVDLASWVLKFHESSAAWTQMRPEARGPLWKTQWSV